MSSRRLLSGTAAVLLLLTLLVGAAAGASATSLVALGSVETSPGLQADLESLPAAEPYGAFVHFAGGTTASQRALLEGHGLLVAAEYAQVDVLYAVGTVAEIRALTREPAVTYLEKNKRLTFHGDTAPWATRSRVAQEAVSGGPYRDGASAILRGAGIGVAIVDSGIDGTHPDLTNRVQRNFKIVCTTPALINTTTEQCFGPIVFVDVGNSASTDNTSGHGTHVSGIVAGDGAASTGSYPVAAAAPNVRGTFTGVAPGASLTGYGTGEVIVVLYATEAFQHILDNYDTFSPRIRVINNSWGDDPGTPYDPNSVISKLVKLLVGKGVTFMFSAGNSGSGTGAPGTADRTSSYCKDPTPGVVCVANYDDAFTAGSASGNGYRDGQLSNSSSRGLNSSPTTYPDLSAPGTFYTSSCVREVQPVCNIGIVDEIRWAPWYGSISGTSMASPHAAGTAALLLQARPELTPAQVEDVLQDTAHKFTAGGAYQDDPQNPGGTTSFDKGAGLVNVPAALDALGVAKDGSGGGGGSGTPDVRITSPLDGSTFGGAETFPVAGTANDGTGSTGTPPEQLILDGDLDPSLPGAADIVKLTVQESAAGVVPAGLTYRMTLRDAADFGGAQSISLRVTQNVNGRPFLTNVITTPTTVSPGTGTPATAIATSVSRSGDVVTFFIPLANLGNPPAGSPAHNVFASSFVALIVDLAPSPATGAGADVLVRPMFGRPYTIARPQVVTPPTAEVKVSLDGDPEQLATLTGTSPSYGWTAPPIDTSPLPDGPHTLTAKLYLSGSTTPAATHTVTFFVQRGPTEFTYDVLINSPADGSVVPRATVEVRGTSFTDDPSTNRRVTLEVLGPQPEAEADATGTSPWTRNVNFDRTPGLYTLTARFYVDDVVKAIHSVQVTVPPPTGDEVSCAGRSMGFWRQQFDTHGESRKFTVGEVETLAFHAVGLSDGYFQNRDQLVAALNAKGDEGAEARAARQFAALLLNLAGGDLSGGMSYKAGLSGDELLDPSVYDTATLGPNVDSARAWIRSQLPNGNLGGANEVGDAINNGQGLICS